ncbi:hypothetical protein Tco_0734150, partial [Tanacetum coccineum]
MVRMMILRVAVGCRGGDGGDDDGEVGLMME